MKKFLSLVLALVMTMSLVTMASAAEKKDFTDAADIDYAEAVEVLRAVGILDGYTDGSFRPDTALNRGQAAKIICNMLLGPTAAAALPTSVAPYSDVPAGSTFAGYIAYLAKEGLVSGYADGTFKPANPLTGYAFMKMLLGVIGYDQTIEGYTGTNWAVSVAKQALATKLYKGMDEFNGSKTVTRQDAMLFAFNALKAKTVSYTEKGTNIVIGGVTIQTGASEASVSATEELYEKLFDDDLEYVIERDEFGRPATTWSWKDEEVGTYGDKADYSITEDTKLYTIGKALGYKTNTTFYYVNGVEMSKVINYYDSTSTLKLSQNVDSMTTYVGNGVTIEFFYDKEVPTYNSIVVIDELINKVTAVDSDDEGAFIVVNYDSTNLKLYTDEKFAKDDYVLYTVGTDGKIVDAKLATKLTGTLSKKVGATAEKSTYTIDGVDYKYHKGLTTELTVGTEYDFYLDSCGFIVKVGASSKAANVDNIVLFTALSGDSTWGLKAKAVYATGKTDTVDLKNAADAYKFYTFTMVDGKVKTTTNTDYYNTYVGGTTSDYYFTKGATKIVDKANANATVVNVNDNTVFVYIEADGDTTTYTGYKNAPTFNGAKAVASFTKKTATAASVVYIWEEGAVKTTSDAALTYLVLDSYSRTVLDNGEKDDLDYYEVRTLAGDKVKVAAAALADVDFYKTYGVAVATKLTYGDNGLVSGITVKNDAKIEIGTLISTDVVDEKDGVVYIAGEGYSYADDVAVWVIDLTKDTETKIDVEAITEKADTYTKWTKIINDNNEIATLILLKK